MRRTRIRFRLLVAAAALFCFALLSQPLPSEDVSRQIDFYTGVKDKTLYPINPPTDYRAPTTGYLQDSKQDVKNKRKTKYKPRRTTVEKPLVIRQLVPPPLVGRVLPAAASELEIPPVVARKTFAIRQLVPPLLIGRIVPPAAAELEIPPVVARKTFATSQLVPSPLIGRIVPPAAAELEMPPVVARKTFATSQLVPPPLIGRVVPAAASKLTIPPVVARRTSNIDKTAGKAHDTTTKAIPMCASEPPSLEGPIKASLKKPSFAQLHKLFPFLKPGGRSEPLHCRARHKVAIIVPYRDRSAQLRTFLYNLHPFLQRQELSYTIYLVEQNGTDLFNRAKLFNVGFTEALKDEDWDCIVFHDVDLLPEDNRNLYRCGKQPRHMSVAIDKFDYELPYDEIFGGVTALTPVQYRKANGMSNSFWGWGGEDDEMRSRLDLVGLGCLRYSTKIARYKMIRHANEEKFHDNPCKLQLMDAVQFRYRSDGLNSLHYTVLKRDKRHLYTRVHVDLMIEQSMAHLKAEGICGIDRNFGSGHLDR